MPDTKVENETELFTLDGDENIYAVDDPSGTPAPRKITPRTLATGQAFKANRDWGAMYASWAGSAPVATNNSGVTTFGTAAGGNAYSTTDERTRRKRVPFSSGAVAGTSAGIRSKDTGFIRGSGSGRGGFRVLFRFAINTFPATWRAFIGIDAVFANPSNGDPSAKLNMIGMAKDTGDTAWQIMSNDGTGVATKQVALNTTNFPINSTSTVFEFELYCPPGNAQNVTYWVRTINGVDANGNDTYANTTTGTISTDLPVVDNPLGWTIYVNNDVQTSAIILDTMRVYWETYGGAG